LAHRRRDGWHGVVVDKEEQRVLGLQADALANQRVKLANGELVGHQILFLVQIGQLTARRFLDDHLMRKIDYLL